MEKKDTSRTDCRHGHWRGEPSAFRLGRRRIIEASVSALVVLALATASVEFTAVRGDVITDWNDIALPLLRGAPQINGSRQFAMLHVAQFEAVNAVIAKYTPYVVNIAAPNASPETAAAQAAHDLLVRFYPTNQAALDAALNTSLSVIADGIPKDSGRMLGATVAQRIWDLRASDGAKLIVSNAFPGGAGLWSPTPGGPATPVLQQYAYVKPWTLHTPSQFRPGPPLDLTSTQWAAELNEIKAVGATNSVSRTQEQTDIGLFIIEVPGFILNSAAKQIVAGMSLSLVDSARLFALMHMAQDDAVAAVFDAKYAYNYWRPVTAIRAADIDGNDATSPDLEWLPLRATPPHPEYPCAHCTVSAAMGAVLASVAGDEFTFTLESPSLPGRPRVFHRISEYVELSLLGRLYAGFHYRFSSLVGTALGRQVGACVIRNTLTAGPSLVGDLRAGEFRLTVRNSGSPVQRIEVSSDLNKWSPLADYTSTDLSVQILDRNTHDAAHRFYRAMLPVP